MYKIVICIPTYRRPAMLEQLLFSIFDNKMDMSLIKEMDIIIVDNDIEKSAETVVNSINEDIGRPGKLIYYNYPVKGLSNVRNELLNQAFLLNPDFIIFIDDDEFVTTNWANELIKSIVSNNADASMGPVIAKLGEPVSKYISYFFRRKDHPDNSRVFKFATGNLIMRRVSIEKFNVRVDNRFNSTGSEDSFFGIQLMKKGARVYWAAKAVVYETIPENRATLNWLIKSHYNHALTYTYILKLEREYFLLIKKTLVSSWYFLTGSLALLAFLFPFKWKYWGILKTAESLGGFAGLFSIHFHEYAKDR
jgi:succinoglycan biosynthesis protein ExoM